jgi:hypothetical protein
MPLPPQPIGGLSIEHLHLLANHFDRAFAASQQVLLACIFTQNALLSQQQELLHSISKLICSRQSESIKRHETLTTEVYDIGKKTDRITKGIRESMKLLVAGTAKAITECQTTIERWLLCTDDWGLATGLRCCVARLPLTEAVCGSDGKNA